MSLRSTVATDCFFVGYTWLIGMMTAKAIATVDVLLFRDSDIDAVIRVINLLSVFAHSIPSSNTEVLSTPRLNSNCRRGMYARSRWPT